MTTAHTGIKHQIQAHGAPSKVAYVRWAPSSAAVQTLTDAQGVTSVSRTSIGLYVITFSSFPAVIIPLGAETIDTGATLYIEAKVKSTDISTGTATVTLKTVAYASVASGPALSDTLAELCFSFLLAGAP